MRIIQLFILGLFFHSSYAMNVAGVELDPVITIDGYDRPLYLNGAGSRTKYIFDIYVVALYLPNPKHQPHDILCEQSSLRIALHFVYDEVSADKLREGWRDGFKNNNSAELL